MLNETKKYVINLKKRPERLAQVKQEFENIGYNDVEVFEGFDLNSHEGCAKSHYEIIKIALEQNLENVIVFEDDIVFMPYAKSLMKDIDEVLLNLNFGTLNLNPSIHRPLDMSKDSNLLLDITNKPPKGENHRGVFGTGFMVYNKSVYQEILNHENELKMIAMDQILDDYIYPNYQSYSPIIPICVQRNNFSDVSGDFYNNFYLQTYNWNVYCPVKLQQSFFDENFVLNLKQNDMNYKDLI